MRHPSPGFTLLELVVAIAIAGALLFLGAPGMGSVIAERELDDRADALIHTLDRARKQETEISTTHSRSRPRLTPSFPGSSLGTRGGWANQVGRE